MNNFTVYLFALLANLTFSTASIGFTHYTKKLTPYNLNLFKVFVAFCSFTVIYLYHGEFFNFLTFPITLLLVSGGLGLFLGDILLFKGYSTLGPSRTLILFSFQPLFVGTYGYFFLGQDLSKYQLLSIGFMISCLLTFALQRQKEVGHYDLKNFAFAFLGIFLDACGVILSRWAFEENHALTGMSVNFFRCFGAILCFTIYSPKSILSIKSTLFSLSKHDRIILIVCSFFGCFVSLSFYLAALKYAHVATLTAISITGPLWVSILECLYHKKLPSKLELLAFCFFLLGFFCLNFESLSLVFNLNK